MLDDLNEALIRSKMAYLAGGLAKIDYLLDTIAIMMRRRSFVIGRRSRLTRGRALRGSKVSDRTLNGFTW